jgi:DNA repair exonuclease SbcCD nuclease subunit
MIRTAMKFIHAADLHIDSPLKGLAAYDGAPVERVRGATRKALHNLVDLCFAESASFLILAGDVFDGDWKDFNTGLYFVKELARLRDAGTRVFIVRGNHDAMSEVTRQLTLPDHVHEFSDDTAETIVLDELGVALHGLSFARREVRDSLVPRYPAPIGGLLNVGVMHTSAGGHAQHATYAPCSVDELTRKGYDYWALGHVHAHDIISREPYIVFPGNTQGRHIKETGPKGCVVVTADKGRVRDVRHTPLDVLRWRQVEVALDGNDGLDELYEKSRAALAKARLGSDGRLTAVRLSVSGAAAAHESISDKRDSVENQLRADTLAEWDDLWLEKIELRTRPPLDLAELRASEGFVGELLRAVAEARRDPEVQAALRAQLQPLVDKLGPELPELGDANLGFGDLQPLLDEVEARLIAGLIAP